MEVALECGRTTKNESDVDVQSPDKKRHSVPEWLRNESGVENKSTGKRRRKDDASDMMMQIWKESQNNRQELQPGKFLLAAMPFCPTSPTSQH